MSSNFNPNPSNWQHQGNNQNFSNLQEQPNVGDKKQDPYFPGSFTPEEIRILRECNKESFYYRCIPLSALFSGLAYIGMKNGYLAKNPRYGYTPKIMLGIFIGYFGGKFSYQTACQEKILRLPNSRLADALRRNKSNTYFPSSSHNDQGFTVESHPSGDLPKEGLILEERTPDFSEHNDGIDSYKKVTENLSPYTEDETKGDKTYTSYDDLRRLNREEYNSKIADKHRKQSTDFSRQPTSSSPGFLPYPESNYGVIESSSRISDSLDSSGHASRLRDEPSSTSSLPTGSYFNQKKNKYGDVLDE